MYIPTHTHTHTHTNIYIYIYIYTHTHIYIYIYIYIYIHIYIYLEPHRLRLGGGCGDLAARLLSADEGELALVESRAMVRVDEVDAGELVGHEDLPRKKPA